MRRASIFSVAGLLVATSSLAWGIARHSEYEAKIVGKDASKIHGSATMKSTKDDAGTVIEVKLEGDAVASVRPWHVHTGSCAKAGGVWGGGRAYTPMTIDAKGNASSTATVALAVPDTGSYYVNIHESSTAMGTIVACGDLKRK